MGLPEGEKDLNAGSLGHAPRRNLPIGSHRIHRRLSHMCPTPTLRWAGGSAVRSARRLLDIDVDLSGAGKPSASLNVNFQSTPFTLFNGFEVLG